MKFITLRKYLLATLIPVILALMCGCGSSGGATPNVVPVVSKGAAVSVIPSGGGQYVIHGDNMDGVAGIALTVIYYGSTLSSPTVAQGGLISGAMMVSDTATPGTIEIAIITAYPKAFSGSGQIASVSFASATGTGTVALASVKLLDIHGDPIP